MPDTTQNALRALLPSASEEGLHAANECLQRYLGLAIEIATSAHQTAPQPVLTQSSDRGTVIAGQVDPVRTFTNTG
jgi:hypothetical protein